MGRTKRTVEKGYEVRLTTNAAQNIKDIVDYISFVRQQPVNAIRVADKIFKSIDRIERNPFAFKECPALATKSKMYRQASCLSWLVIYKITDNEIIIAGTIHASRKPSILKAFRKFR